ncbi:hypothetical protein DQ04_01001090 [Trypanosoma grayi]|uniref:hypothetical protein n=1 Tax=Trypanosoma grayi TaxID=71804 RepID=UPI0004F4312B|nr:hypothetical protein DQ04_01001090 [Trypanosoma grayi]KEG13446.1 hypothetical protein DQ04_01001090 [Trypanosoma grayi]
MPMTAAIVADVNPLHAVLAEMLAERTAVPTKRTVAVPEKSDWRTRQVLRELKGLKSPEDVSSSEEQIRGVVASQESRCRVKLMNGFLSGQYLTEEQAIVCEEERRSRNSIISLATSTLQSQATWLALIWREMYQRCCIEEMFVTERMDFQKCSEVGILVACEQHSRRCLMQMESMNRKETNQRRFLSVGREIDMELLRQQSHRLNALASQASSKLVLDMALLSAEEERQRCSLERLYLLKLSLMSNDQENAAARLVVTSVMRASLLRRRLEDDKWWREHAAQLLMLPLREGDLRGMIERDEMEKRQDIRVSFLVSWREVFKRVIGPSEGAAIVERLELYERRCVFDQWRFGFNALAERQNREKCLLAQREAEYDQFFHGVIDSLRALWKQEGEQFDRLRKMYSNFLWSDRMVKATLVLDVEERYMRQKIIEAEIREAVVLRSRVHKHQLEAAALQETASIMEMESIVRHSLTQCFKGVVKNHLCAQLCRREERRRFKIESEARAKWTDIVLKDAAQSGRSVDALGHLEETQRFLLVQEEKQRLMYRILSTLTSQEKTERQRIEQTELSNRFITYASVLGCVEEWNRLGLQTESQHDLLRVLLCNLVDRESIERAFITDCELRRRDFLFGSFDYAHPQLRACEVDELDGRLDIITESELSMNAFAYTHGVYDRVTYSTEELRSVHSTLRFMSSRELLQFHEVELVRVVEPLTRAEIVERETYERLVLTIEAQEYRGRFCIEKNASKAYEGIQNLFDRIIYRADEWRKRGPVRELVVPSEREVLVDYFRRQEASVPARLKAQREKTRELLGSFFEEFYLGRDDIVLKEFVAREGLVNALRRPRSVMSCTAPVDASQINVRFYSLTLVTSVELKPMSMKVYDSVDDVGITCELREAQAIAAAGSVFRVCFPLHQMEWVRPLREESNALYFEAGDNEGNVVASASLLLRSSELMASIGATVVSVPLDDQRGKINVVLHVG